MMFATKETKKQNRGLVAPIKRQNSQDMADGTRQSASSPGSTHFLQRNLGNSYMQSVKGWQQSPGNTFHQNLGIGKVQAKRGQSELTISQPSDSYERDADHVAHQVTYRPTSSAKENKGENCLSGPAYKVLPHSSVSVPPNVTQWLRKAGAGRPLSDSARHDMEQRFNADFTSVRIHTGEYNEYAASLLGANAFTYKNHIFLGKGQSESDHKLIAHELVHTLQQSGRELNGSLATMNEQPPGSKFSLSRLPAQGLQRSIDYPAGSGWRIGDIMRGPWHQQDLRLDNVRFIDYSWSEWPTGLCQCDHQIKVRVEEYSSVGFLGALKVHDYCEWYWWNHEYNCTGPEGACARHHLREGPRSEWRAYDEKGDAPQSNRDTLSLIGSIASIAGLVVSVLALLASAEPEGETSEEAVA